MRIILFIYLFFSLVSVQAQVFSDKVVGDKNQEIIDSLRTKKYPYVLPIWGQKVTNLGYDLPYSAGISINYIGQESDILINNLQVGFNGGQMFEMDDIVRFTETTSRSSSINIRPDVWLFPFLNVYGIFAKSSLSTQVALDVYAPTAGNDEPLFDYNTQVDFEGTTFGIGFTPTMGVGGGWVALDMNVTWNDIAQLDDPAVAFVFGPRLGKQFKFRNPERALSVWVGGFRLKINTGTKGNLNASDVIPFPVEVEMKIEGGIDELAQRQEDLDDWYNSLTPPEQIINKPIYDAKTAVLGKANEVMYRALDVVQNVQTSTIQYSIDKYPRNKWNFIVGSQFQLNKRWMIRGEVGFLGSRTQILGGLQYRFGI